MDNPLEQNQKAGAESTNYQAGQLVIHQHTLGYRDIKDIALDVFRNNFATLSQVAREVATTRAEEITEQFLSRLQKENNEGLQQAETPRFQLSLLTAQKEYARSGDADLGGLLVDLLIDLSKQDDRSIQQLVLDECLVVAPKLTPNLLATLGVVFYCRYARSPNAYTAKQVADLLEQIVIPFVDLLSKKETPYRHLEYAGCGTIGFAVVELENALQAHYPAAFIDGFSANELAAALPDIDQRGVITRCAQNPGKLQFNVSALADLSELFADVSTEEKAHSLWKSKVWPPQKVKSELIELLPEIEKVFDVWHNSGMKQLKLTTVGMAIGHAYLTSKTNIKAELSIWVN